MTAVTKKRTREILEEALELMNDGGKHWIKGALSQQKPEIGMCYCAIGAIETAAGEVLGEGEQAACAALLSALPPIPWVSQGLPICLTGHRRNRCLIEQWNDGFTTTWKDVVEAFKKAIKEV